LSKRNTILVSWCCMCKSDREMVPHLLLHCSSAREIWQWFLG